MLQPPVAKKPEDDMEERPGSRLGFVAMAPNTSPREAIEQKPKVSLEELSNLA